MQKFLIRLTLLLALSMFGMMSLAQDSLLININESDTFITIPADWQDETSDDGVLTVSNESVSLMVYTAATLEELFEIEAAEIPEEQLEAVIEELPLGDDAEFDVEEIDTVTIDERDAANLTFATDEARGTITALTLDDDSIAIIVQTISDVPPIGITETIEDMIESLNATSSTSKAVTDSSADTETATSSEACFISTPDTNTVQIRVGPGTNRTVIAFLPALVEFEALGQTTDDAGNVWFRVAQEEAAPTKAVNETWVAAADVEQSGDCSNVVDAAAPPIIPIRQAQPTPVPQVETATDSTGEDTTTAPDAPAAPAVDASGSIIPVAGNWFASYGIGNVRCGSASTSYDSGVGTFTSPLSGGGSGGILWDGFFYSFSGSNTYESSSVLQTEFGDVVVRETFTLTSDRTATGSLGFVNGACTYFVPFTINYVG